LAAKVAENKGFSSYFEFRPHAGIFGKLRTIDFVAGAVIGQRRKWLI
jgi:hypothetical protein